MKPFKGARSISRSLLRSFPIYYIFSNSANLKEILTWNLTDLNYLSILGIAVSSALLIVGGFFKTQSITIVSGLLLFGFSILMLVLNLGEANIMSFSIILAIIGLFFVTNGNNTTT